MNRLNHMASSAAAVRSSARGRALRLLAGAAPLIAATPAMADGCCTLSGGAQFVGTHDECTTRNGTWWGEGTRCTNFYSPAGGAVSIPDASPTGIPGTASVSMTVPDSFAVGGAHLAVYVPHQRQGDLRITLTHMNTGHSAVLVDRPGVGVSPSGFTAQNFGVPSGSGALIFDAGASGPYASPPVPPPGISNVTGFYRPVGAFSAFTGESAAGTWQITAIDFAPGSTGSIVGATLMLDAPPPVLPAGGAAATAQGTIADADTCLLALATGFGGALSYNSSYNGSTWTGQLCGTAQGQSACLTYTGQTAGPTAALATWSVSGQVAGQAVSGSGSMVFSGSAPYSVALHESLHVGARTFTRDGTCTAPVDPQGYVNINSGTDVIADDANPGQGGNPGWGPRWIRDNNTGMWISVYRAWDPWYGWQDYAFNESYFGPVGINGSFTMTQAVHRSCYANCDGSTLAPALNVADFTCYLQKYANGDPYANCDGSTLAPVLNVADFSCFLQKYSNGCP